MKKSELTFSVILVPIDYIAILLGGVSAYFLRYSKFYQENIREIVFSLPFGGYLMTALIVALFWVGIFALTGLYTIGARRKFIDEFAKIFVACSAGLALITFLIFFKRELFDSRFIVLAAWGLAIIYVTVGRFVVRKVQQYFVKKGYGIKRVVLIGKESMIKSIEAEMKEKSSLGFRVVKIYDELNESVRDKIRNMARGVDEVILADVDASRREALKLLDICNENHLAYKYTADILNTRTANVEITTMDSTPIIEIKRTPLDGWGRVAKRIFDILVSLILIVLFSPVMIAIAIAVKLGSKGPVFADIPNRAGERNKPFRFLKFRSMYMGAHKDQNKFESEREGLFKLGDDPRITKMGRFIRKWSIDELPQLFNVLRGEMSLVGPRPHFPNEYNNYQRRVLTIKPGISGLAQISGRSDLSFDDEVKLDLYYIENWSMVMDLGILLKTPFVVLKKRVEG